jgi:hypothetical protein
MAEKMIAYCGLVCAECPAYVATQADDVEALERVAARWSEELDTTLTAADCLCDGCISGSERLCSYCGECEVRACAVARDVINCAHCDDYGCEKITGFLALAPEAKTMLEEIRKSL